MSTITESVRIAHLELPPLGELERQWRDLESRSECSFFMSWCWIGAWLASLPTRIHPRLLRAEAGGRVVGLGVIVPKTVRRHGVFTSRALFLNSTGDPEL